MFKYDHIIRVESLQDDLAILLNDIHLTIPPESILSFGGRFTQSNFTLERYFMLQLNEDQRQLLYEKVYKNDFILFNNYYSYKWLNPNFPGWGMY